MNDKSFGGWGRYYERHYAVYSEIELAGAASIDVVRRHLARFWSQRKDISASQAEDLVASVLKDHYGANVQRYSANTFAPDGGIDLLVVEKNGVVQRAVQVKRRLTEAAEAISEVRDFIGAMILAGQKRGTFVTTASKFSPPTIAATKSANLARHKLDVELIDGERLLELLENSNANREQKLPKLIDRNVPWVSEDGHLQVESDKLFFGDVARLVTK